MSMPNADASLHCGMVTLHHMWVQLRPKSGFSKLPSKGSIISVDAWRREKR